MIYYKNKIKYQTHQQYILVNSKKICGGNLKKENKIYDRCTFGKKKKNLKKVNNIVCEKRKKELIFKKEKKRKRENSFRLFMFEY